jgi:CPA2 family monovalent cation:H+ antiporter-2
MHAIGFIQDLAVIMAIAGIVTILFHRFKQPVVLGYIVAGIIIGPHTPPFNLIHDQHVIQILAELGVVFLMFSLGLEFSIRKLASVGLTALVAAASEIALMIWIGYEVGQFFGWSAMDSIFLGAMLAISSTTIIVKALDELGMKRENFAQLIFGILIVEDILGIAMIALLSGIATSGTVQAQDVFSTLGQLSLFMIVALVLGLLIVPRLLAYVSTFKSNEMMLVSVLGLCFAFCLMVIKLEYSVALGAFMIGAVMAEARELHLIERLIEPVRDLFSAIFFVTVGLMFDPRVFITYAVPVLVITVAVVLGKVVSCGLGAFVSGQDGRTSLRTGMGMAQIGEFSFIIAALGLTLKVTSEFLYPIVVAVSALTTLFTPYLIKLADPLSAGLAKAMPGGVKQFFNRYPAWLASKQPQGEAAQIRGIILKILLQVLVNCALIAAIFIAGNYLASLAWQRFATAADIEMQRTIAWGCALFIALPFLIATYRKLKAFSLLLAELWFSSASAKARGKWVAEIIPLAAIVAILFLIGALSAGILPPIEYLAMELVAAAILCALLWKPFVKLHVRLQVALIETFQADKDAAH